MKNTFVSHQENSNFDIQHLITLLLWEVFKQLLRSLAKGCVLQSQYAHLHSM